ncbi:glycoside hydrolase [Ascobolus immersus RN42]|uniref:Probable beta-glucosidase btgE n=1 Tax=Ascobolus immersus RN42 TaxID=1160509 RepID=A0A3N4IQ99_ASCIM|nr:glycoside hydrolase [Ascobolus immersus RN42]
MRYNYTALALGALVAGATAAGHHGHHRRHHLHARNPLGTAVAGNPSCEAKCTTYVTSYLVDVEPATTAPVQSTATIVPVAPSETPVVEEPVLPPVTESTTSTSTSTDFVTTTVTKDEPVPTPAITTIHEPGTYTIPATTVTLTQTTAVCVPEVTTLPAGEVTYGGVTTVVSTSTVVECPVPTAITNDGKVTYTLTSTAYECPTPGTYIIGGTTTVNAVPVTVEVPVVTQYEPGTYTRPATTVTATVTDFVVTCPLETVTATQTVVPVAPTEAPEAPKAETPNAEAPKEETPAPAPVEEQDPVETVVKSEPSAPSSTKSVSATPVPTKAPTTEFIKKEGLWAITYSPYNDDQSCKSQADVERDIAAIAAKGFKSIRLYSPECDGLKNVGGACKKNGLKIILGVFIKAGGTQNGDADKQVEEIINWKQWDLLDFFVIGNEAVFQGFLTGAELAAYMDKVSAQVRAAGYGGQITTAEPVNILATVKEHLCPRMDVVGVNVHPFFNPNNTPDFAGQFVKNEMALAKEYCGNTKDVVVLETGWPSRGSCVGSACPSKENQRAALKSIEAKNSGHVVYFTYRNDLWKHEGPYHVEQSFGCGDLF